MCELAEVSDLGGTVGSRLEFFGSDDVAFHRDRWCWLPRLRTLRGSIARPARSRPYASPMGSPPPAQRVASRGRVLPGVGLESVITASSPPSSCRSPGAPATWTETFRCTCTATATRSVHGYGYGYGEMWPSLEQLERLDQRGVALIDRAVEPVVRGELSGRLPHPFLRHVLGRVRRKAVRLDPVRVLREPRLSFLVEPVARPVVDDEEGQVPRQSAAFF